MILHKNNFSNLATENKHISFGNIDLPGAGFFGLSIFLFMMQPWVSEIKSIPLHVLMIWILFIWTAIFRSSSLKNALLFFSGSQWIAIIIIFISILIRSFLDDLNMLRIAQLLTGIMIALLGGLYFQHNKKRSILIFSMSLGLIISCSIAILQTFIRSRWIWEKTVYSSFGYIYGSTGLETSPVSFSYSILGISMMLLGLWLIQCRYRLKLTRLSLFFGFIISLLIIAGLAVSNSRSGMLGLMSGIIVIAIGGKNFQKQTKVHNKYRTVEMNFKHSLNSGVITFRSLFINAMVFFIIISISAYIIVIREAKLTQDARLGATYQTYFPLILKHPFGLPNVSNNIKALDDLRYNYSSLLKKTGGVLIAPHNLFLTTGVSYGPLAAIALLSLYASAILKGKRAISDLLKSGYTVESFWVLLLISTNVSILSHSWFHNASIAIGEMRNWLWLGFLMSIITSSSQTQKKV